MLNNQDRACVTMFLRGRVFDIKSPSRPQILGAMKHLTYDTNWLFIQGASKIKPINHIVDIGANIGSTALLFHLAFPDATILALEPAKINYDCLLLNTEHVPQITTLPIGAYDKRCRVRLAMPSLEQRSDVDSKYTNGGLLSIYGKDSRSSEFVEMDQLDDIVSTPVDLLKIDVEGAEIGVLDGAKRILSEDRPLILVELRPQNMAMAGYTVPFYEEYIREMGYEPMGNYLGDAILCPKELDKTAWKQTTS